ncbi:hypothetical protein ABIC51_004553 [Burkholderia sp. 572]
MPALPAGRLPCAREDLVGIAHERLRVGQETLAERRQLRAVPPALEQLAAEARLQRADLLAQCRLAHVQRIGRAAEMAQLGDGQERTQQFQFHS